MKKLIHTLLTFLLVVTYTLAPLNTAKLAAVYAEDATPTPTEQSQAPATPQPPSTPQPPTTTPTPAATAPSAPASPTPYPGAATPQPAATAKPAKTAKPSSAATAQPAATPVSAVTPIPSVTQTPPPDTVVTTGTGGQNGNSQTGDSTVTTGDANVDGSLVNSVNNNVSGAGGTSGSGAGGSEVVNGSNGDSSNNNANANNNTSSDQALSNSADLSNDVALGASSGSNTASRNTGDGTVVTGDANVGVTVINGANNNVSGLEVNQYDVNGNQTGDIILGSTAATASCGGASATCTNGVLGSKAKNTGNGIDSTSNASSNNNSLSAANLSNNADVVNDVAIDAVTGRNSADSNVGSGNVETGDANVGVTILNFLNNNIIAGTVDVINIFGDYVGNIILPESQQAAGPAGNHAAGNQVSANRANGDSSNNNASSSANVNNNTSQANLADINNGIDVNANTGNNNVRSNTNGENNVETGDTNVNANVYNVANVNSADGGYIVLVNDHGTWKGTIYGANGKAAGSEGVNFTVQPDGTVVADNNGNGTASDNNAQASSNATNNTTQTNNAKVKNNIKINADTGNNSASRNVGGGSVKTGNVNVAASVMNFVNNNFVGKTFRVVLVNVLGKWTGSVVPPGQSAPSPAQGGSNNNQAVAGAQTENTSSPAPTASSAPEEIADGTVLGKMTLAKAGSVLGASTKQGATISLKDGHKYLVDDTLNVPNDKPIVASAVGVNKKTAQVFDWKWLFAGLVAFPFVGVYAIKRIKNKREAEVIAE